MKRIVMIGIVLIVLGAAGLIIKSVTYRGDSTTIDLGPIDITATQEKRLDIPAVAAQAAIAVGALMVIIGALSRRD